jgi:hypothetical protein
MARWAKRLVACKYAGCGRTKMDWLIGERLVRAKKESDSRSSPVYVDLDSIDEYRENLPDAKGTINPRRQKSGQHAA